MPTTFSCFDTVLNSLVPVMSSEKGQDTRRTPSPEEALHFVETEYKYSPTPGADTSSQSSPGSASDHMGILPGQTTLLQPLYPGASVLAAFEATSHMNRVITTKQEPMDTKPRRRTKAEHEGGGGGGINRRQKRLQRNRESARLSRRRRKQYLEVLEERVDKMSDDLDRSRRQHIAEAVITIRQKRNEHILQENTASLPVLGTSLARTSEELMVSTTFQSQQLKSFAVPPSTQFILWLTLQTEAYFRGGRAASERLSAARIGERVSQTFLPFSPAFYRLSQLFF